MVVGKEVFRSLKDPYCAPLHYIKKRDGTYTFNTKDKINEIDAAWDPIFNGESVPTQATPHQFLQEYHRQIENLKRPIDLQRHDGDFLFQIVQAKHADTAGGLDQWRICELQHLPRIYFFLLAELYTVIEAHAKWPQPVFHVSVANIPKPDTEPTPLGMRGIALTSVLYSLWSASRYKMLKHWQATTFPDSLYGAIQKRGVIESELLFGIQLEDAKKTHNPVIALLLDKAKYFDLCRPPLLIALMEKLGIPSTLGDTLRAFYNGMRRYTKVGKAYGDPVFPRRSILQGCSLSCLLVNCVGALATTIIHEHAPRVKTAIYLDDHKMWTSYQDKNQIKTAWQHTDRLDKRLGNITNLEKSNILYNDYKAATRFKQDLGGGFAVTTHAKSLGHYHNMQSNRRTANQDKRVKKAVKVSNRIERLPIPKEAKSRYIISNVMSTFTFGTCLQLPSVAALNELGSNIVRTIWGRGKPNRSSAAVLSIIGDGSCDPIQYCYMHILCTMRHYFIRYPEVRAIFQSAWPNHQEQIIRAKYGLISNVKYLCQEMRWILDHESLSFNRYNDVSLGLLSGSDSWFKGEVMRGTRMMALSKLQQRKDFVNLQRRWVHIDRDTTCNAIEKAVKGKNNKAVQNALEMLEPFSRREKAILKSLTAGATMTGDRLAASGFGSNLCPLCKEQELTLDHVALECPCLKNSRDKLPNEVKDILHYDPIARQHGIFVEDQTSTQIRNYHNSIGFDILDTINGRTSTNGLVFTDGACTNQANPATRSAAAGCWIEDTNTSHGLPLPGLNQTAVRAEMWAIALALRCTEGNITICTDNKYVSDHLQYVIDGVIDIKELDNFDLWEIICKECVARSGTITSVIKVKAHVEESECVTGWDFRAKVGNDAADEAATKAAKSRVPQQLGNAANEKIVLCTFVQTFLVWAWKSIYDQLPIEQALYPDKNACLDDIDEDILQKHIEKLHESNQKAQKSLEEKELFNKIAVSCRQNRFDQHLWGIMCQNYAQFLGRQQDIDFPVAQQCTDTVLTTLTTMSWPIHNHDAYKYTYVELFLLICIRMKTHPFEPTDTVATAARKVATAIEQLDPTCTIKGFKKLRAIRHTRCFSGSDARGIQATPLTSRYERYRISATLACARSSGWDWIPDYSILFGDSGSVGGAAVGEPAAAFSDLYHDNNIIAVS